MEKNLNVLNLLMVKIQVLPVIIKCEYVELLLRMEKLIVISDGKHQEIIATDLASLSAIIDYDIEKLRLKKDKIVRKK
jgi:hypothetical protein